MIPAITEKISTMLQLYGNHFAAIIVATIAKIDFSLIIAIMWKLALTHPYRSPGCLTGMSSNINITSSHMVWNMPGSSVLVTLLLLIAFHRRCWSKS